MDRERETFKSAVDVTSLRKGQVKGLEDGPSLRLYKNNHQLDLTAICRALHTSTVENFSNAHKSLTETDQILRYLEILRESCLDSAFLTSLALFFFFFPAVPCSMFPDQGSNLCPLHWNLRVLTTGSPGKSPSLLPGCSGAQII